MRAADSVGADPMGADPMNADPTGAALSALDPGQPTLFPPVGYSFWWAALAAVVLLGVVAYYVLVPLLTRARERAEPTGVGWLPGETPLELRARYLGLVTEVEQSHARGELGARASHQRLSLLLRSYAYETTGLGAPRMTLADLRRARAVPLAGAVERLYPGAFREVERGGVAEAAALTRRVIDSWS